jgi:SAM-dependent methyltransferase
MVAAMDARLRRAGLELVAASFLVLFQELALIRWLGAQVRVLAYFPNLVLISAFLGLGLGALRAGRARLLWLWPLALATLVLVSAALARIPFTQDSRAASEHLFLLYYDLPPDTPVVEGVRLPIALCFALSAFCFVPLGQLVAERIARFAERGRALHGYAWDLVGSLGGSAAFALASFAGSAPRTWFAVMFGIGAVFLRGRTLAGWAGSALAVALVVLRLDHAEAYSPYYAINVIPDYRNSLVVLANGSLHQTGVSLRRDRPPASERNARILRGYHLPYEMLGRAPRRALVLGAGTGNDVAVLLDRGAEQIDAVEIDPLILAAGRADHPDRPYDSPRVRVFTTDARTYLNQTRERYDLIVFGTLDSLTRLSALSNVRLDNFVYTEECLRAARGHLTPDGGVILYFAAATDYIHSHLVGMLARAFGVLPHFVTESFDLFNTIYVAGPGFARLAPHPAAASERYFGEVLPALDLPSDDWPFLYLERRGVTPFYASLIALILALAAASVWLVSPRASAGLRAGAVDLEMLLYGAGFLLLESKFVTSMNLLWGATWITSAVVFGAILATVLAAALAMQRAPRASGALVALTLAALALHASIPTAALLGLSGPARLAASIASVGLPVFFASALFAVRFRARPDPAAALAWNLLGSVLGGLLEFLAMALGLAALSGVAALAYLLGYLRSRGGREAEAGA